MTSLALALAFYLYVPPAGDAYRLPPVRELTAGRLFNQQYQAELKKQFEMGVVRGAGAWGALADAQYLHEVWNAAEGAHPDWGCHEEAKTNYLRKLRLLLGPDAYRRMELPPCVPVWRFNQLR